MAVFHWTYWPLYAQMVGMKANTNNLPTLQELEPLSSSQLKILYTRLIQTKAPPKASTDFLKGNIAWIIQAIQSGKSPNKLRTQLLKRSQKTDLTSVKTQRHKTGTRLIREWQGRTYEVTILEKGYLWQDQIYRSLSQIAQEITGSHWSGPRFFGLK